MLKSKSVLAGLVVCGVGISLFAMAQQPPQAPPAPTPAVLQNYKPVTSDRLKRPDDADWLMGRRTYDGWGYSPLEKINNGNVSRLKLVWRIDTGETRVHESAPVVNSGVMLFKSNDSVVNKTAA